MNNNPGLMNKLKARYMRNYKEAKISKYIKTNVTMLFYITTMGIYDYFFEERSFLEIIVGVFVVFIIMSFIYSIFSPTLWGWALKKRKKR